MLFHLNFVFSQLFDSILHFTDLPKESRLSYCQVQKQENLIFQYDAFLFAFFKWILNLMICSIVDQTKYAFFALQHQFPISFLILLFWVSNPPASVANLIPDDKTFCTSGRIPYGKLVESQTGKLNLLTTLSHFLLIAKPKLPKYQTPNLFSFISSADLAPHLVMHPIHPIPPFSPQCYIHPG